MYVILTIHVDYVILNNVIREGVIPTRQKTIRIMHILEIPSFFPPCGGLFCLDQAKALKANGNEVRILSNVQLSVRMGLKDFISRTSRRHWHNLDGIEVYQSYQKGCPKVIRYNVGLYQIDIIETSTRFEIWVYCETCGTRDLVFDFDKETEG